MAPYKVWRIKRNKYNPSWLEIISKTKVSQDRQDWIAFIQSWKTWVEDKDWEPWKELRDSWKKPRRFKYSELRRFDRNWKLPFSPTIGTGQGLSHIDRRLFERIKRELRARGEGKACWACEAIPSREIGLNAHEFWKFDYQHRVRRLKVVRFLCTDCHYLTHDANMMFLGLPDENVIRLTELYCRVNECKLVEAYSYLTFFASENFGDTGKWTADLSEFETTVM